MNVLDSFCSVNIRGKQHDFEVTVVVKDERVSAYNIIIQLDMRSLLKC